MSSRKTIIFRKFRKNQKNYHFLQSLTLKMAGLLQLKLPTSTPVDFLINALIINLLQHIFFTGGESRFSIPKIKRSDFSVCLPDFCFSNRKACDLCSPENLSGDHRKHSGKCENSGFSPTLQMAQFSLKISSGNEKADRRSGRRSIFKMVGAAGVEPATFCSQSRRASHCAMPRRVDISIKYPV